MSLDAVIHSLAGDPLTDILRLTQATSVMAGGIAAGGRWAVHFPPPGEMKISVVAKGGCWFRLDGHKKAIRGEPGDAFLLPGRRGFLVGSDLSAPPLDAMCLLAQKRHLFSTLGDGSEVLLLAGGVTLDPRHADLVQGALPPFLHVRATAPQAASIRWLIEQLLAEQTARGAPGAFLSASMLAQLLFVQILRAHLATAPRLPAGWLRVIRDERLAAALRLLHGEPARDWKLEELARAAAMSRTTFAVRFKEAAGVAPLQYLTAWRIRLAERRLRDETAPISQIAAALGYSSESAFSQAFKRVTGKRPRDYRNEARG
ncbi:cupin domain-containing protein [Sorangium sp. So ce1182]|uniref:AraC family transcriptional regulator n=1 Tax=Sorangium sp. So ce1182 TaxID=3133334 RepID=UPI003F5E13E6